MKIINKILCFTSLMMAVSSITGCDKKTPDKGYINSDQVKEIINGFDQCLKDIVKKDDQGNETVVSQGTNRYTSYKVEGKLNYFAIAEDQVPRTISRTMNLEASDEKYSRTTSSYYLSLPLYITPTNWNIDDVNLETSGKKTYDSTKYALESRLYRTGDTTCTCYYYSRPEGGFIVRTFAENKKLRIEKPSSIECNAKWNVTVEYDANGYLVSEKFSTINAFEKADDKTVYGEATYVFS